MLNRTSEATLLVELLTEELPPKNLAKLGSAFHDHLCKGLQENGFVSAENLSSCWYATPRRLAVQVANCKAVQADRVIEKKGPAVASGLDAAGQPSKALAGFLRSVNVPFAALQRQHDGKAEYFVARLEKRGEPLAAHLSGLVDAALKKLPVAKLMRWGCGEAQFVRPVHGLVMLHGEALVPGEVLGLTSQRSTKGHRFLASGDITLTHADDYAATLETQGKVIASFATRRDAIVQALDRAAAQAGLTWLRDEALLDEVTGLVEWPQVYVAAFDPAFLAVPQECLILTMQANQKYFPLMDDKQLSHRFLVVSNMAVADPTHIIEGNARVVRPRLADAQFFFTTDCKTPLAHRLDKLARVVYHNRLGTQGERVVRLQTLAAWIAPQIGADVDATRRAALLAKADLTTGMVGEFPELQGIMGRYYALHDQESPEVAQAISDHYKPRFNGDTLPQNAIGCALALADKLDTLAGFFSIDETPTGDRDPFALRRAALGILRLLLTHRLPLDLRALIAQASAGLTHPMQAVQQTQLYEFMIERLRRYLPEQGRPQRLVDAILALAPTRLDDLEARLDALAVFSTLPEAEALAAANKRIINLLRKNPADGITLQPDLLQSPAERALSERLTEHAPHIAQAIEQKDYRAALTTLAGLRNAVDAFFDQVMVLCDDPALRANRLALLARLAQQMNQVADISRL